MKLKIEKMFFDKYTDEKYEIGEIKEFEEARAKELLADKRGLVSAIKAEEPAQEPAQEPKEAQPEKPKRSKK